MATLSVSCFNLKSSLLVGSNCAKKKRRNKRRSERRREGRKERRKEGR